MYYWENQVGIRPDRGSFSAKSDTEAVNRMPKSAMCLYKESDTPDGEPFIMVYPQVDVCGV